MNHGIGNVKAKGGGHPTITLSASQFTDDTYLTFTQEQVEILQNNEVVNVVLPDNSTRTIYKSTNSFNGIIIFSKSTLDVSSENGGIMNNVVALCNPSTYEGMVIQAELKGTLANPTLSGNEADLTSIGIGSDIYKVGGGKQLYEHNICLHITDNSTEIDGLVVFVKVINSSSTALTKHDLYQFLFDNGFKATDERIVTKQDWFKGYLANGTLNTAGSGSGNVKAIIASSLVNDRIFFITVNTASYIDYTNSVINDIVLSL